MCIYIYIYTHIYTYIYYILYMYIYIYIYTHIYTLLEAPRRKNGNLEIPAFDTPQSSNMLDFRAKVRKG